MKDLNLKTGIIKIKKRKDIYFLVGAPSPYHMYSVAFDDLKNGTFKYNHKKTNQKIINDYIQFTNLDIETIRKNIFTVEDIQKILIFLNEINDDLITYIKHNK